MLFIAKLSYLLGRLWSLGGTLESMGLWFLEGVVSIYVLYLQGAALPLSLFCFCFFASV